MYLYMCDLEKAICETCNKLTFSAKCNKVKYWFCEADFTVAIVPFVDGGTLKEHSHTLWSIFITSFFFIENLWSVQLLLRALYFKIKSRLGCLDKGLKNPSSVFFPRSMLQIRNEYYAFHSKPFKWRFIETWIDAELYGIA